jgi:hypothetical protein
MGQRLELQALLETIVDHVYFQPPNSLTMEYPCIRYRLSDEKAAHADNVPYNHTKRYQLTIIDRNPDTLIPSVVRNLPRISFSRFYAAENLNHYVYDLYF